MYNKLISLFILIAVFGGIYFFFYYFFVLNKGALILKSNISDYKVTMYTDKLKTSFSTQCKKQRCELIDLAPFDYEITIEKKGYKNYKSTLKINNKSTSELSISLEKQISINQINSENDLTDIKVSVSGSGINKLDKFRELAVLQKSYKFFDLEKLGYFYFIKNEDGTLSLFNKNNGIDINIYSFNEIEKKELDIQKIYGADNSVLIIYGDEKDIYDLEKGSIEKIFFPQDVRYIKKYLNTFYFVNDKGIFLYDIKNQKINNFEIFKDFINYDKDNYLGIIFRDEIEKKKKYNLEKYDEGNLIIKYNITTKNIKVLETISQDITKIVKENNSIYFYDDNGNKYLVDNIE